MNKITSILSTYGTVIAVTCKEKLIETLLSYITGYNHTKYWTRRQKLFNNKLSLLKRLYYYVYIKRCDAKHLSSFGTTISGGATFSSPPKLPHGMNGIIVGSDAVIGRDVYIYQQVKILEGGVVIGDNVLLGSGCKILRHVHIGNNVRVGANCIVVDDIPDGATVVMQKPRIIIKDNAK